MLDFLDGKAFGTAAVGAVTAATCYQAGMDIWAFVGLALTTMIGYLLVFRHEPR